MKRITLRRTGFKSPAAVHEACRCRQYATETLAEANQSKKTEQKFRRFWSAVDVGRSEDGFNVKLDTRSLKTPEGNTMTIPKSKETLAQLVAGEWNSLHTATIRHHSLPLTSLCSRAIDFWANAKLPEQQTKTMSDFLRFLDTDTTLIYAPEDEYEGRLLKAQIHEWGPLKLWGEAFWGVQLKALHGDDGFVAPGQSEDTKLKVLAWMRSLSPWQLAALERSIMTTKSVLISSQFVIGILSIEEAAALAGLETRFQTERWGEVEDTHDVDHADVRRQLASAKLVLMGEIVHQQ